jgi:hypothetical protein
LVTQGIVSGALAYWDTDTQSYQFVQGSEGLMQPNTGYWIFVFTAQDFTLSFPPVFAPFLPNSTRSVEEPQTDNDWKLNLVVRNDSSIDTANYIGQAPSTNAAKLNRAMDPPMGPTQKVNLAIEEMINGKATRMAKTYMDRAGRKEFKVFVDVREAGPVTVTWPNMGSVPKNMRFRLIDTTNNITKDLRNTSGYTFTANEPGTREFKLQVEPGSGSVAVIGNVTVARGRSGNDPFVINYSLSGPATTSVRILSASGREVYVVTRGRSDGQGENSITWATRDNAGRSVAPGTYRVEIIAESENGQRARKIIPINVTR